jgi:hypothetical protein
MKIILISFYALIGILLAGQEQMDFNPAGGLKPNIDYGTFAVGLYTLESGNYERVISRNQHKFFKTYLLKLSAGKYIGWAEEGTS